MRSLEHAHVSVTKEVTAGTGINKRVYLGLTNREAAIIKMLYLDLYGTQMYQGLSVDPEKVGCISVDAVWSSRDIIFMNWGIGYALGFALPEPGLVVVRDLLYMVDISITGTLNYGLHVLYEKRDISELEEAQILTKRR